MAVDIPQDMQDALNEFDTAAEKIVQSFSNNMQAEAVPEVIYHYTNDTGMRGILESGRLWLSDMFSLNDPSELRHGISHAVEILNAKAKNGPPEAVFFAEQFAHFLESGVEHSAHFFVLSFSEDGDELGQWRAYADNGRGYALGFDGKSVEDAFIKEIGASTALNSTFRVTYNDNILKDLHRRIIDSMFHLISLPRGRQLSPAALKEYIVNLQSLMSVHVMLAAVLFKHEAYKNEREFRFLQLFRAGVVPPDVKRRFRSYELVKYRDFDWRSGNAAALKQIIVGPAADHRKGVRFADECLAAFNPGVVEVTPSGIPYRAV